MINIVVPMAGLGSRFAQQGYTDPKPFIDVNGKRMIERVIENLKPTRPHKFIFIAQREHLDKYNGREILEKAAPGCVIIPIDAVTQGAACTVLLAEPYIDNNHPLMIANSDQLVDTDIDQYLSSVEWRYGCNDAVIMTMRRDETKWSFVGRSRFGYINRVVEKQPISNEATVGIYNWRMGKHFVECAKAMIAGNRRFNNEFYVAPVFQELIDLGGRVEVIEIPKEKFHSLGTPEDLKEYLE